MQTNGFTLLEMCIVLCILSTLFLCVPAMNQNDDSYVLHMETQRIVALLHRARLQAILTRSTIHVDIDSEQIKIEGETYSFSSSFTCSSLSLSFNGRGNVNMANTIRCTNGQETSEIVINLGNGNVYAR